MKIPVLLGGAVAMHASGFAYVQVEYIAGGQVLMWMALALWAK